MLDRTEHIAGHALDIQCLLIGHIGNAEATAQIELCQSHVQFGINLAVQAHDALGGKLEAFRVEYLGAHMAVQAAQVQVLCFQAALSCGESRTGG